MCRGHLCCRGRGGLRTQHGVEEYIVQCVFHHLSCPFILDETLVNNCSVDKFYRILMLGTLDCHWTLESLWCSLSGLNYLFLA